MALRALQLLLLALISGCVQTGALSTPFNPMEHEFAIQQGQATVSGQAFFRRNDGVVVYAAGSEVFLVPSTGYTQEIFGKVGGAPFGINLTNLDGRLAKYVRRTQANGEGRFIFSGIPDGTYMVVTNVVWMAGDMRQGGDLTRMITVSAGQNVDVILTR